VKERSIRGHFDEKSTAKQFLWICIAALAFVLFFYAGTAVMSIIYPLEEAALGF
jgi:hypothetical protein